MTLALDPAVWKRKSWAGDPGDVVETKGTIVLEPTAAQLDRGERVLWVEETSSKEATKLLKAARESGWDARLSRARFLSAIPVTGGRAGRRHEVETIAVRMLHVERSLSAYAVWHFDVERARWGFDSAALARVTSWEPFTIDGPVGWGAREIMAIVKGGRV